MEKGTLEFHDFPGDGAKFGYEDYDIDCFGGGDYEVSYTIDEENKVKMTKLLSEQYEGSLKEMIIAHFGIHCDQDSLAGWMNDHGIEYRLFTWIS